MRDDIYTNSNALYPTRNNIINAIKELMIKSNNGSVKQIYFHYSGHGSFIQDISGDEKDRKDEFIVPIDYVTNGRKIIDDELFQLLKQLSNNTKCFFVFDCCNSGTIIDLQYSYALTNKIFVESVENSDVSLINKSDIICLSAVRDNEYALDVSQNGKANGAFSLGLYTALNQMKWISNLNDLLANLYQFMINNNYKSQRPLLTSNKKINLNNCFFNFKSLVPVPAPAPAPTPAPSPAPAPAPAPDTSKPTNPNISTIQNLLQMSVNNKLLTKQELKDLVIQITG